MNVCGGAIALFFVCASVHICALSQSVYVYVQAKHIYTQMCVCACVFIHMCIYRQTDRQHTHMYTCSMKIFTFSGYTHSYYTYIVPVYIYTIKFRNL